MRKSTGLFFRSFLFVLFVLIAGPFSCAFGQAADSISHPSGIIFEHGSFAEACAKAKAEGKLVFLDFWATWCGPCMEMTNVVFKEREVADYFNSHFVNLKVEAGKKEWKDLFSRYQVEALPAFVFVDGDGAVYLFKSHDWMYGPAFVKWAGQALKEFSDPGSLPRLEARYASQKDDTAFLIKYMDKRIANNVRSCATLDHYLSIQTAMPSGSRAMLDFLLRYQSQWYYGGKAAAILSQEEGNYRKMATPSQLAALEEGKTAMPGMTLSYAFQIKSERLLDLYIREAEKAAAESAKTDTSSVLPRFRPDPVSFRETIRLEYFAATGEWTRYRKLADMALNRIAGLLKPDPNPDRVRNWDTVETPSQVAMKGLASIVSAEARVYGNQFRGEPGVQEKVLHWMKLAVGAYPCDPNMLSRYANVLYEHGDSAKAVRIKQRVPANYPKDYPVPETLSANLLHMQKGEPLEVETTVFN